MKIVAYVHFDRKHCIAPIANFGYRKGGKFENIAVLVDPPCAEKDLRNCVKGKIAIVERGKCTFPEKALRVQNAGAVAMIVANNEIFAPLDAFTMGEIEAGEADLVEIPCVMLSFQSMQQLMIYNYDTQQCLISIEVVVSDQVGLLRKYPEMAINACSGYSPRQEWKTWNQFLKPIVECQVKQSGEQEKRFTFIRYANTTTSFVLHFAPQATFGQSLPNGIVDATMVVAQPPLADAPLINDVEGKLVLIERGGCSFPEKVKRAQTAGALAVIIANNDMENPGTAFVMSAHPSAVTDVNIPSVMVSYDVASKIRNNEIQQACLVSVHGDCAAVLLRVSYPQYSLTSIPAYVTENHQTVMNELHASQEPEYVNNIQSIVDMIDTWWLTPIHYACMMQDVEKLAHLLIELQTNISAVDFTTMINQQDIGGQTAMHYAAILNDNECLQLLLAYGASTKFQNQAGQTSLHIVCRLGYTPCAETLLSATAKKLANTQTLYTEINIQDYLGCTSLHQACLQLHVDIVFMLIAAKCDTHLLCHNGKSALDCLCRGLNVVPRRDDLFAAVEHLIKLGATMTVDEKGNLPIDFMENSGDRQHLQMLFFRMTLGMQATKLIDIQKTNKALENRIEEYNAEHATNQTLLQEANDDRIALRSKVGAQQKLINRLEIQFATVMQHVAKLSNTKNSKTETLLKDEIASSVSTADVVDEAAFLRDVGKRYLRQRKYEEATEYFLKSRQMHPLPGLIELLDACTSLKERDQLHAKAEDIQQFASLSVQNMIESYRQKLSNIGLSQSAFDIVNKEIKALDEMSKNDDRYFNLCKWLDWLTTLPWGQLDASIGLGTFQRLENLDEEYQRQAVSTIVRAIRQYSLDRIKKNHHTAAATIQYNYRTYVANKQNLLKGSRMDVPYNSKVDPFAIAKLPSVMFQRGILLQQNHTSNNDESTRKFYVLQQLRSSESSKYYVWHRWGIVGEAGQSAYKGPYSENSANKEFNKLFRGKAKCPWDTKTKWGNSNSSNAYVPIEIAATGHAMNI